MANLCAAQQLKFKFCRERNFMITKTNNNAILFDAGKSSRDHTLHNGAQYLKIESEDFKKKIF